MVAVAARHHSKPDVLTLLTHRNPGIFSTLSLSALLCCLFAGSHPQVAHAQAVPANAIAITEQDVEQPIAAGIEYYEDGSELLTIADVLAPNFNVNFIPHQRDIVHFGLTSSAYLVAIQAGLVGCQSGDHTNS